MWLNGLDTGAALALCLFDLDSASRAKVDTYVHIQQYI
jgi:hypothetical protein